MAETTTNGKLTNNTKQPKKLSDGILSTKKVEEKKTPGLVKLISVRLKEAALDSPSFRANCNYYDSQIDLTEQWIDGLIKSMKKYPQQYNDFKDLNSVFLQQLIPDFLKNGLIDQEVTVAILETTKTNIQSIWAKDFQDLDVNYNEMVELLNEIRKNHLTKYKDIRKSFEFIQSRYDSLLSKYASMAKTKDPSASREDAFQLFDVRKSYLESSLNVCTEISKFHEQLDIAMVKISNLTFKGKESYNHKYFGKVNAWSEAMHVSFESLLIDMNRSKDQIYKATLAQLEPSRNLKQHDSSTINSANLAKFDPLIDNPDEEISFEKHGWVFMKTTVGKPTRTIWVRRWIFIKSSIFGMLMVSPSKNFVQETDKIGVLLCNIRYAPDEDRRFCFEVKTIETTIILQAETLKELRSWMRVFSQEKSRAIDNSQNESGQYAFGRFPPLLFDFASTYLTSMDIELTSSKVENSNTDDTITTLTSSHLSKLLGQGENNSSEPSHVPTLDIRDLGTMKTPISTEKSQAALIAHSFLSHTVVPSAITANTWGSVNWGMYYITDASNRHDQKLGLSNSSAYTTSLNKEVYPSYYPALLQRYDIQLKSLFEAAVDKDELVVMHFKCLSSVNPTQELSGSCFTTTKNAYIYLNSAGFVSLIKKPLSQLVAVDVVSEKNWDVMKVYDIEGLNLKSRIFLEDGKLIQKTMDLLINNSTNENPKSPEEIIKAIDTLRSNESVSQIIPDPEPPIDRKALSQRHQGLESFQPFDGALANEQTMRTNFKQEYDQCQVQILNIPAKAVFHMLYGDHSSIFRDNAPFVDTDDYRISPWYTKDGKFVRIVDYKLNISSSLINLRGVEGNISARRTQTIEQLIDNKYYRINDVGNQAKAFGSNLRLSKKVIIIEENAKSCKMIVYSNIDFSNSRLWFTSNLYRKSVFHFHRMEVLNTFKVLELLGSKLGPHGKIIKAIRTYGNLSKSNEPFPEKEEVIAIINFNLVFKYYTKILLFGAFDFFVSLIRFVIINGSRIYGSMSTHKGLILLLLSSIFLNIFLSGKSSFSFWKSWRLEQSLMKFKDSIELNRIERSISLQESDLLTTIDFNNTSKVFAKYLSTTGIRDITQSDSDSKFRDRKYRLALKRNELFVELKILENVEKELVAGHYRNFLLSELNICNLALESDDYNDERLKDYCVSCTEELQKITSFDLI